MTNVEEIRFCDMRDSAEELQRLAISLAKDAKEVTDPKELAKKLRAITDRINNISHALTNAAVYLERQES